VQVHLIPRPPEHRRAAGRAEVAILVVPPLAGDRHRLGRKDRRGEERGAAVLAAVEGVAQADAGRLGLATNRTSPHRQPPVVCSGASLICG